MPNPTRLIALAAVATAGGLAGCGGDDEPEPSIPLDSATTLVSTLQEVQDNVDVGSCTVAARVAQEFQAELEGLPSSVDQEVIEALQRGSQNLLGLIEEDCDDQPEETTTTETTTQETTTEETTTEQPTTTQPTEPTTPTTPTEPPPDPGGGGIGPPGE